MSSPLVGLVLAMLLVWQSSYASFTGTTGNGVNNWTAGAVIVTDDDAGAAMFTAASKLRPGSAGSRCIVVTSTSTVSTTVKLYGSGLATTNGLASHVDLVVTRGAGGTVDCTGFSGSTTVYTGPMSNFTATNWTGGYGAWAMTSSTTENATYRFDFTLNTGAPSSTQGGTAQVTFVWEARS